MDQSLQEFVQQERVRFREEEVLIYITKKCCEECLFFSEVVIPSTLKEEAIRHTLADETMIECLAITVAERRGYATPEVSCCFGFYYNFLDRIPILQDAQRDGRIRFFDISHLPGLRETGYKIIEQQGYSHERFIPIRKREENDEEK